MKSPSPLDTKQGNQQSFLHARQPAGWGAVSLSPITTSPSKRFTVLVVDDHPIVAQVIANACEERPSLEVLGFVTSGFEALERCRRSNPDVLVLDLGMPGIDGFEVGRQLNEAGPRRTRILVVSGYDSPETTLRCMRLGVEGLLQKTWPAEHIAAAVEAVAAGAQVFSTEQRRAVQPVLADIARRSRAANAISAFLTRRERDVLRLMVRGYTNRQVARELGIAERTVEGHLVGLYGKLGVRSRVKAANRAVELNLVDLSAAAPAETGAMA